MNYATPPTVRHIGLVIFPGFQLLDAAGPITAFEIASRLGRPDRVEPSANGGAYSLALLASVAGEVASSAGVSLQARPLAEAGAIDTLLVAGGDGVRTATQDEALVEFIRTAPARRIASVCSGAFLLAAAGRLDGRRATTHWSRSDALARSYPAVRVEADRIFVQDGAIWTSAGITAGIDLCLALIAEDLGEDIARRTAQQMVVYRQRPGGQSQFSALLEMDRPAGRFSGLMGWMRERLDQPLGVEQLAAQCAMSPRNFTRRFTAEVGVTPARAVERLRVEAARAWLEDSAEPVDRIARLSGFGDAERMRGAFLRAFGHPPQALRRANRRMQDTTA